MGFRFQRRIKILPGITMNMGKTGSSISVGTRGAHVTFGQNGIRKTFGIPGTGLSYSTYDRYTGNSHGKQSINRPTQPQNNLEVGFISRLFLCKEEKSFIDGIRFLINGKTSEALNILSKLPTVADACFTSGMLFASEGKYIEALDVFQKAESNSRDLGVLYSKYNIHVGLSFPITEYLSIDLTPSLYALLLVKASFLKQLNKTAEACSLLVSLYRQDNTNILTLISLSDLILEATNPGEKWLRSLIVMTDNQTNDTPIHTVLLYYRAMILCELHYYDSALSLLSTIARKKSERPQEILKAILSAKAEIYEIQGKKSQARSIWEKILAEFPSDSYVMQKLKALN